MKMLDLFCGRLGWSKAFLARGWKCEGIDLVQPPQEPPGFYFIQRDVLELSAAAISDGHFDFICASPPCEQFSVFGMRHFHPNPPYPELGIKLFNHTREICEASGVPYVIENVRAAQQFVGQAKHHCGPFYLWGTGVPPLLAPRGKLRKNFHGLPGNKFERVRHSADATREMRNDYQRGVNQAAGGSNQRANYAATIPPELAHTVADYAERLLEQGYVNV